MKARVGPSLERVGAKEPKTHQQQEPTLAEQGGRFFPLPEWKRVEENTHKNAYLIAMGQNLVLKLPVNAKGIVE